MDDEGINRNEYINKELDALCRLVDSNLEMLRQASMSRKFELGELTFTLFRYGRNVIYRIKGNCSWFLKITRYINKEAIRKELFGAKMIRRVLNNHSCYWHPLVRTSVENSYVIYSEIPGNTLHMNFYYGCLIPFKGKFNKVRNVFHCFGEVLAHLHAADINCDAPRLNRNSYTILKKNISMISKHDDVIAKINHKLELNPSTKNELKFVHGNLRFDNVLVIKNRVCIIDFENCGIGSPYEDISNVFCRLILTSIMSMFPVKRAFKLLFSFLEGYKTVHDVDIDVLLDWTAVKVAMYYVENHDKMPKIAKMPVSKQRLRRFLLYLLDGDSESALPGYKFDNI